MENQNHSHVKTYIVIFSSLMALTALTVGVAFVDLGSFNIIVAMSIAILKGSLVVLFFMHLIESDHVVWVYVAGGFLWLVILLALTFSDYFTRLPLK